MRIHLLVALLFCVSFNLSSQGTTPFQQDEINKLLQNGFEAHHDFNTSIPSSHQTNPDHLIPLLNIIDQVKKNPSDPTRVHSALPQLQSIDTLIVGLVPNDTLVITGNWTHTGPIWVLGTGVLIFRNANVIDTGDVYVFGNGQWIADSSSFFFPQNYFYERTFLVLQNASAHFGNCSMNYSGLSHSLVAANNAIIDWQNVDQNDWTTCGLYGSPTVNINHCNISGEYVITDSATVNLNHADTIILWHQFPAPALINFSFPASNPVYNYAFNNTIPGVSGVNYAVNADSCNFVSWAIMPANGSDVTISNSNLRLIGAWFQDGDTTSTLGIMNNSSYSNYTAPLTDRNLQLINTAVQTWSFYLFDSSQVTIDSCQLGEVGTQQRSNVIANNVLLDGSGGYFWATDSSVTLAANSICYSTCRSEKKGLFILAYSWMPFAAPTAVHNSNLVCVQNDLVLDPVPYDGSVAWLLHIDGPDTASTNAVFAVNGSAWINQGPLGNPVDFGSYSLYYQNPFVSATWYPIVIDSLVEISHNALAHWNTHALLPGTYVLKAVLKNNFNDSVEGFKVIELLSNPLAVDELKEATSSVYPNPFAAEAIFKTTTQLSDASLIIYDAVGKKVRITDNISGTNIRIGREDLSPGIYFLEVRENGNVIAREKIMINE
jgi:hypothetical protein